MALSDSRQKVVISRDRRASGEKNDTVGSSIRAKKLRKHEMIRRRCK